MTYHQVSQITTLSDPAALEAVLAWFDQFTAAPIPHQLLLQCQLAVIEGFTNAIRHGHRHLPMQTPVRIQVEISEQSIDIQIWDQGPGFDLASALESSLKDDNQELAGGRGLKIINQVADRLTYHPDPGRGNCLHLHRQLPWSQGGMDRP
ncbi:MAG: ATP-binding protein [Nodosilinea sp.]